MGIWVRSSHSIPYFPFPAMYKIYALFFLLKQGELFKIPIPTESMDNLFFCRK